MGTSPGIPILLSLLLLALPSCYSITHDYDGPHEITPGTRLSQPNMKIGEIDDYKKATFLLWGIIPLNDGSAPQLADELATDQFGQGFSGITDLKIHEEQGAVDIIVGILTLGIFEMVTVEVDCDVHGATEGAN